MKILICLSGTIALALALNAQTNSIIAPTKADPSSVINSNPVPDSLTSTNLRQTDIFADRLDVDSRTRKAVYTGNVRVVDPRIKMTCDRVTAQIGERTNNFRHIIAEGNVVIDAMDDENKAVHATAETAVYWYQIVSSTTNETVELSGNPFPRVEREGNNYIVGKSILWDRRAGTFHIQEIAQHVTGLEGFTGTNKPASRTSSTNRTR